MSHCNAARCGLFGERLVSNIDKPLRESKSVNSISLLVYHIQDIVFVLLLASLPQDIRQSGRVPGIGCAPNFPKFDVLGLRFVDTEHIDRNGSAIDVGGILKVVLGVVVRR